MTDGGETGYGSGQAGPGRWLGALPDAAAFAAGLGIAWYFGWKARDLVWSLWLSSLLVGYSIIVWRIFGPAITDFLMPPDTGAPLGARAALAGIRMFGGLFLLAFFTVHFGMFHYVHSVFLNTFFPVLDGARKGAPTSGAYLQVLRTYWPFVLVAALAERDAFRVRTAARGSDGFMEAYKNVLRMHLLLFFFFFAHIIKLENIVVYGIIYAVYFFPWRMLRRPKSPAPAAAPARG